MEIITIESQKAEGRRLTQGIALTRNISDLSEIEGDQLIVEGICIVYVEAGKASFTIEGEEFKVQEGELVFVNYGQHISDILYSSNLQFRVFFLSKDFMETLAARLDLSWSIRIDMKQTSHLKFMVNESEKRNIYLYYELLESKREQTRHQQEGIDALCEAFGYEILDMMEQHEILSKDCTPDNLEHTAMQQHFKRFMQLLSDGESIERKVNWYASQLCITPKYLNMICQQIVQQSPSTLIEEELTQRAIKMLKENSLSIKETALKLGFNNQSHFGTFMRRTTGKSPMELKG